MQTCFTKWFSVHSSGAACRHTPVWLCTCKAARVISPAKRKECVRIVASILQESLFASLPGSCRAHHSTHLPAAASIQGSRTRACSCGGKNGIIDTHSGKYTLITRPHISQHTQKGICGEGVDRTGACDTRHLPSIRTAVKGAFMQKNSAHDTLYSLSKHSCNPGSASSLQDSPWQRTNQRHLK